MPDVSKVKLPNNSVFDIISKTGRGIVRCETASTSTATAFVVTAPGITELYDGIILSIKNTVVTSTSGCTLNVNGLGAKSIWRSLNNALLTSQWAIATEYLFIYDATNDRWVIQQGYNTDEDANAYTVYRYYSGAKSGEISVFQNTLIMQRPNGTWESIVTSSTTEMTKERNTHGFLLNDIMYWNSSTVAPDTYLPTQHMVAHAGSRNNASYVFNIANTAANGFTAYAPVYLVGTVGSDGLFYLDDPWWSQTLPTTEDGKLYIYVGSAQDRYRMPYSANHPMYCYTNGMVRQFAQDCATVTGHTVAKDVPSNAVFTDTTYTGTGAISVNSSTHVISTTAEVNQNAFSNIKVGSTTIAADSKTDTLELVAGSNITLTPDATNDKVTIAASDNNTTYTFANGTNGFTVTPSGGTAQTVTVTPSITNNITGSGTTGSLAKFTGANTVGDATASANSATTGISVADHATGTITGVQTTTTTASKVTLGTAITVPNVTDVGSASTWAFENITVPKAASSATSIPNVTAVGSGSFTQGAFSGGSGSFTATVTNGTLSFSHTHTAATHGADTHVHTAPTLGTAISVTGVSGSTTASHVKSGGNGTAPTLGTAISVPNVTDVSSVTVPIKNTSATTVVTGKTHTVTDNGHTHTVSVSST